MSATTVAFKLLTTASDGLIVGILALGIYISFQWLRFPDLSPDASFTAGACAYVLCVASTRSVVLSLFLAALSGGAVGLATACINRLAGVPTVVASLISASAFYSVCWLAMGRPNTYLESSLVLPGVAPGLVGAARLAGWLLAISTAVVICLHLVANSVWGLRVRALGERPHLAQDLGLSLTGYTIGGLVGANCLAGLAGGLFTNRSFSADINMGLGVTLSGLTGMLLGLLLARRSRSQWRLAVAVVVGAVAYRSLVFLALQFGAPGEAFRLAAAGVLVGGFIVMRRSRADLFRGLRWN